MLVSTGKNNFSTSVLCNTTPIDKVFGHYYSMGELVVFVLVVSCFGIVFFFFSFKVLLWKAATLYKNV